MSKSICVIIPVKGRLSLLAWTLDRLLGSGYKVVCVGSDYEAEDLVRLMGADWVYHPNFPLGMKYNAGWEYAMRKYDPDFYVMGNASDWYSNGLIESMIVNIGNNKAIGLINKHYYNVSDLGSRLCFVKNGRLGGSGLVVRGDVVRDWGGRIFNDVMDMDLDWSILDNLKGHIGIYRGNIPLLSISFHKWPNAYNFETYWCNGVMMGDGRDFLREHFKDCIDMTLW
jgi:hypothetical protein